MKTTWLSIFTAAALTGVSSSATISVNFTDSDAENLASSELAGAPGVDTRVGNWNNVRAGKTGEAAGLVDSEGTVTGVGISFSSDLGGWRTGSIGTDDGDGKLWRGYLDADSGSSILVSGLDPLLAYDVYIYFDGDNGSNWRVAEFTVNGITLAGEDSENTNWGAGQNTGRIYQQPVAGPNGNQPFTGDGSPNNSEGNYVKFANVSGDITISAVGGATTASGGVKRAPINGFQIVAVPEPSISVLVVLAGAGLLLRRRS